MGGAREKNRSVNSSPDARKKKTETQRADRWTLMRNRTGPKNLADVATLIAHGVPLESYLEIARSLLHPTEDDSPVPVHSSSNFGTTIDHTTSFL